jgi:hypothetical protein
VLEDPGPHGATLYSADSNLQTAAGLSGSKIPICGTVNLEITCNCTDGTCTAGANTFTQECK